MGVNAVSNDEPFVTLDNAIARAIAMTPTANKINGIVVPRFLKDAGLDIELAARGFRSFKPVSAGSMGVVLETAEHQVIRLCHHRTHPDMAHFRANALQEAQSIEIGERGKVIYEILPQYPQTHGDFSAQERMKTNLLGRGYFEYGNHFKDNGSDTGYLSNGEAVMLDPDSLDGTRHYTYDPVADAPWVIAAAGKRSARFDLPEGLISMQEHDCPALVDGRVRGVLSDEDRVRLEAGELAALRIEKPECFAGLKTAQLPKFISDVFDEGLYPAQALVRLGISTASVVQAPMLEGRVHDFAGRGV